MKGVVLIQTEREQRQIRYELRCMYTDEPHRKTKTCMRLAERLVDEAEKRGSDGGKRRERMRQTASEVILQMWAEHAERGTTLRRKTQT
jgi:hypothetical protein